MRGFVLLLCIMLAAGTVPAIAQSAGTDSHYVTIGVFAIHDNAIRLTNKASKLGLSAQYAINPSKK